MRVLRILSCASVVAALGPAFAAQQEKPAAAPATTTIRVQEIRLQRVGSDLIGKTLVTPKNEPLGKVEDIVIHPKGEIAFIEFSGAGALQTGMNRYPVPFRALSRNEHDQLVLASTAW